MHNNLIRTGKVSTINASAGTARVSFEDRSNVVSYDLQIVVRGSKEAKDYWMPVPGEQVLCVFLPHGRSQGFILGSLYSLKDQPPASDQAQRCMEFVDGTRLEYDSASHVLRIHVAGPIQIIADGDVQVTGDVTADGISLKHHTHSGSGSGPPAGGG